MAACRQWIQWGLGVAAMSLVACSGGDGDDGPGPPPPGDDDATEDTSPTADTGTPEVPGPDLNIDPKNNYTASYDWTFPAPLVVRAENDFNMDWGGVGSDAWGVERAAGSYDKLLIYQFQGSPEDFEALLEADDLEGNNDVVGLFTADIEGRGSIFSNAVDDLDAASFFTDSNYLTWFVALADEVDERFDIRTGFFLEPDDSAATSLAEFPNEETTVSFSATIGGAPLQTAAKHDRFTAEWRDVTQTVLGADYDRFVIDQLFIGFWADAPNPADLSGSVLELKSKATRWYTADITGDRDILLELARDDELNNFPGFEAGGTWLLGARCACESGRCEELSDRATTCLTSAPAWLTVVEVQ